MQSDTADRLPGSPEFETESSFPERYLEDDPFSGNGPDRYQPAGTKGDTEATGHAPFTSQRWPSHSTPYPPYNYGRVSGPLPVGNGFEPLTAKTIKVYPHDALIGGNHPSAPFLRTTAPMQADWAPYPEQSLEGLFWQPAHSEFTPEDDSDSVQSPSGSPSNFGHPPPTLSAAQKPRRPSTRGLAKLTTAPTPASGHYPTRRIDRPYIPDFDYNTDRLDPSDPASVFSEFLPRPNHDISVNNGSEIEITYRDSSSSSKVDSKRIAHKLSEKTRRNRLTIAIREIQKLLPSEGDESPSQSQKEIDFVVRPGVPSSKLDVVEMAVGFIKDLKAKNTVMARRLSEVEQKLEQCHCQQGGGGMVTMSVSTPAPLNP